MSAQEPTSSSYASAARPRARTLAADETLLDALDQGVIVVDREWRVLSSNRASTDEVRVATGAGSSLWEVAPVLAGSATAATLRATMADGRPRRFRLFLEELDAPVDGRVARAADERLVVSLTIATVAADYRATAAAEENAGLRALARQLAAVSDAGELLAMLSEAALAQCHASGSGVIATSHTMGELVAATGLLAPVRGRRFELEGSLAAEAVQARRAVAVADFSASMRPLARLVPDLPVGPVLAAPLIAHDTTLGVLVVARERGAAPFSVRDEQRLHVIADHAALALWKAELLERAQAADRAKGRFLATVSHELRTPLTALTGYEELLVDQVIGPLSDAQLDVLERMRSVTAHLTAVIEEVLAFSSIEEGREAPRPTEFLAADLLHATAAVADPLARQKGLQLAVDVPHEPLRLTNDIDKMRQILVNLAANAVKFTDVGEVRLSAAPERRDGEAWVRFAVRDTGIGISAPDMGRLFRPFAQVDSGLTRRHGGTGLGLYISHRLAVLLGGRIEVESSVGRGSTFSLLVPAVLRTA